MSLEKIIGLVLSDVTLNKTVMQTLWNWVANSAGGGNIRTNLTKDEITAGALRVISLVLNINTDGNEKKASGIRCSKEIVLQQGHVDVLVHIGLSDDVFKRNDFDTMKSSMLCLQSLPTFLEHSALSQSYPTSALFKSVEKAFPLLVKCICGHFIVEGGDEQITRSNNTIHSI